MLWTIFMCRLFVSRVTFFFVWFVALHFHRYYVDHELHLTLST